MTALVLLARDVPYYERLRRLQYEDGVHRVAINNYIGWVIRVPESRIADAEPSLTYDSSKGPALSMEWEGGPGGVIDYTVNLYGDGTMWLCVMDDEDRPGDIDWVGAFSLPKLVAFFMSGVLPR